MMRSKALTTVGTMIVAAAIAGCGGSDKEKSGGDLTSSVHRGYLAGCTRAGQSNAACECLYTELTEKQGIDTQAKFEALSKKVQEATQAPDPAAAMPAQFRAAATACKSQIKPTPPSGG